MRRPYTSPAEQYRLVMDCRQSGLSDARWCKENDVKPSTFYNWVTRLRKKGCEIPEPTGRENFLPLPHQDVVRVDLVPDVPFVDVTPSKSTVVSTGLETSAMTLDFEGAKIGISNDVNPELLLSVLHFLRGSSC